MQPVPTSSPTSTDWTGRAAIAVWTIMLGVVFLLVLVKPTSPSLNILWRDTGRAWINGENLYLTAEHFGYRYGPLFAAAMALLAKLPLGVSAIVVRLVNTAVLLGAIFAWLKQAAPGKLDAPARGLFLILLAFLNLPNLQSGQFNPMLIGLLIGSIAACQAQRWNTAAALLALATVLKVYPLAFALLLVAVYPRQLLWRLPLAVLAGLALPFLMQHPSYVLREYRQWLWLLRVNDDYRRFLPMTMSETYRDLLYLFRLHGIPMSLRIYAGLQALTGLGCAFVCWTAQRRGLPRQVVLWHVLVLGSCWLTLCGPASEPRTYVILVPALAWWVVWTYQNGPKLACLLAAQACGLLLLGVVSSVSAHSVMYFRSAGLHPIAALLLLASHLSAVPFRSASAQDGLASEAKQADLTTPTTRAA